MTAITLYLVAAFLERNQGIGFKNDLPWKRLLKADLHYFNILTTYGFNPETLEFGSRNMTSIIIMGRKTWDSIPASKRPLPDRLNYIITSKKEQLEREIGETQNVKVFESLDDAAKDATLKHPDSQIFVVGGSQIYKAALDSDYKCKLFITKVKSEEFEADVFFPEFDESKFKEHNITAAVHKELIRKQVKQTWQLEQKEDFVEENGTRYSFFLYE